MKSLSLSELKDALTALGVGTATGNLRGEARRDELARRLHNAKVEAGLTEEGEVNSVDHELDKLSLSELRSALELRQISTQTPGLKGEARRHALIQRLVNTGWTNSGVCVDFGSGRTGSSDEDEVGDTKSETNSSVYSTATEFIFYDTRSNKKGVDTELQLKAIGLTPQLSFARLKKDEPENDTSASSARTEQLQRELFELRTKLHTSRQEQQQLVDRSLKEAGIAPTLEEISAKLQALERERQRLQENYFGHELVTSDTLSSGGSTDVPPEFIQEDALVLIEKRQESLKNLAERTKEAMAVAKFHAVEIQSGISKSARQEEVNLLLQIRQAELSLYSASVQTPSSCTPKASAATEAHVLARCRSIAGGLRSDLWQQMNTEERRQLQNELRTAASFHIRRNRVSLIIPASSGASSQIPQPPSLADKLGMKAQFMEKAKRNPDDILQVYQKALEIDDSHAQNLGNYALFLCATCGEIDLAREYFQRAIAADPIHAKNLANYANFLMRRRGEFLESEVYYKRALEVAPKDVNILGGYADLLTANTRGNRESLLLARQVLKKALSLSPLHTKNQLRLALVLVDLKETHLAERCFEKILADLTQHQNAAKGDRLIQKRMNHTTLAAIYENYANFLHQRGLWARAKNMYDEALALDPDRPSLLRNFSCFLRESKSFLSPRNELGNPAVVAEQAKSTSTTVGDFRKLPGSKYRDPGRYW